MLLLALQNKQKLSSKVTSNQSKHCSPAGAGPADTFSLPQPNSVQVWTPAPPGPWNVTPQSTWHNTLKGVWATDFFICGHNLPRHICIVQHRRRQLCTMLRTCQTPRAMMHTWQPALTSSPTQRISQPPLRGSYLHAWFLPAVGCAADLEFSVLSKPSRFSQECLSGGDAGDQVVLK